MHTHTTYSDGILTPKELIELAILKGLSGIAITDHDNICGLGPALKYIEEMKINFKIIKGIEISSSYKGENVHILGYNIDITNKDLLRYVKDIKEKRYKRAIKLLKNLNNLGVDIKIKEVTQLTENRLITRPNIGRVLIEKGYVDSMDEAFSSYLSERADIYVSYDKIGIKDAIKLIKAAGGDAYLAHPGLNSLDVFKKIIDMGFDGIECYHPKHSKDQILYFISIAKKMNLKISGGSDFHGSKAKDDINLGNYYINLKE